MADGLVGFAVLYHDREPTFALFLDGPLIQLYQRFLQRRGLAMATIVKNMGHVRLKRTLPSTTLPV